MIVEISFLKVRLCKLFKSFEERFSSTELTFDITPSSKALALQKIFFDK